MINDLKEQGYEFLFIRKNGDKKTIYEAPPAVVKNARKSVGYDYGSLRAKLYKHIKANFLGNQQDNMINRLKLEQNEKRMRMKEIIKARTNQNKLGTINPHWVPSCYDYEIKDSEMKTDYGYNARVADEEIEAAIIKQNRVDEEEKGRDIGMMVSFYFCVAIRY